jgi:hypothetical protein
MNLFRADTLTDNQNIVKYVSRVWRIYKRQKPLFQSAMRSQMPCRCRYLLGKRYMVYALFKKDIGRIYEEVKCAFNEGELASIVRSTDQPDLDQEDRNAYISKLLRGQQDLYEPYQALLSQIDNDRAATQICSGHLEKLAELAESLAHYKARVSRQEQAYRFWSHERFSGPQVGHLRKNKCQKFPKAKSPS